MQRIHRLLIVGALALLTVVAVSGASAGPYTTGSVVQASGTSPFSATCGLTPGVDPGSPTGQGIVFVNSEVEPWIDVNPTNPNNVVGIYQQDRWSNGGARGLVASVSTNGGTSWMQVVIPKVSLCSGGPYDRASDPWVTFSPNGHVYAMSLSASADLRRSAMLVNKSTDGGLTWSDPITLIDETSDFNFNDKNSMTADPNDSDFVYAVWDRSRHPGQTLEDPNFNALRSAAFRSDIMFSRTTDGGATWEPARAIFRPEANLFTIGNQIAVLPDGTLVDAFFLIRGSGRQPSLNQYREAVIISTDKGETWAGPIIVDRHVVAPVRDPDTGQAHRTGDIIPDVAVDAGTGAMYVVWQDGRFTGRAAIALSRSTDGGRTWSTPIKVNQTPLLGNLNDQAFTPSVHVAADGTVGVSYYDFRFNAAGGGTDTDHFLVHCHAACTSAASWVGSETRVTPASFDSRRAPVARGFFLGDYVGLDNIGNRFTPFFTQTTATDRANEYFATVGP
jgi:BNR repeat-like domain